MLDLCGGGKEKLKMSVRADLVPVAQPLVDLPSSYGPKCPDWVPNGSNLN